MSKESSKKEKKSKKEVIAGAENADSSKQQRKSKSKRDAKVVKKGIWLIPYLTACLLDVLQRGNTFQSFKLITTFIENYVM